VSIKGRKEDGRRTCVRGGNKNIYPLASMNCGGKGVSINGFDYLLRYIVVEIL